MTGPSAGASAGSSIRPPLGPFAEPLTRRAVRHEAPDGVDGVTDGGRVLAAALGHVRLAATTAAEGLGCGAHQICSRP